MLNKYLAGAFALAALAQSGQAQIYISEICDATLSGGQPKWVAITNDSGAEIPDMSIYSIQNINNGGLTTNFDSTPFNAVALPAGDTYVFAYESAGNTGCDPNALVTCFEFVYGVPADQYAGSFINGDDVVSVYEGIAVGLGGGINMDGPGDGSDAILIDRYGEVGIDGNDANWEYLDSYSRRCTATGNPTFTESEWFFAGANALEGADDVEELANAQANTTPFVAEGCSMPPMVYCVGKASSAGCIAAISTSSPTSNPTALANDYSLTASGIQGFKNGLAFAGISGQASIPFSGGTLCVQPPTRRGPISNSLGTTPTSCDGTFSVVINGSDVIPAGISGGAGQTLNYQWWYRDPMNGMGTLGTALSEGIQIDFQ